MKQSFKIMLSSAGLLACILSSTAQNNTAQFNNKTGGNFTLHGSIKGAEGKKIYLFTMKDGVQVRDSVFSNDGSFVFKGSLQHPSIYNMTVEKVRGGFTVFMQAGDITAHADTTQNYANLVVKGSEEHNLYNTFREITKKGTMPATVINEYMALQQKKDSAGMKRIDEEWNKKGDEMIEEVKRFVQKHPENFVSGYAIQAFMNGGYKEDELEQAYLSLSDQVKQSGYGIYIKRKIDADNMLAIGKVAPDFVQNDVNGQPLRLSSLRGKYVLIDFWASWCRPCRVENPNVVKAYQAYKDKGLDILGVSLDRPDAKEAWLKAIKDDQLTWHHVSDLKFWNNEVALQYNIKAIPFNLLLDPNGKIVGRDLRGEKLQNKLRELLP